MEDSLEALDKIDAGKELLKAVIHVRKIIMEGAKVGFNPHDGGNWAERLFRSQAITLKAIKKAKEVGL